MNKEVINNIINEFCVLLDEIATKFPNSKEMIKTRYDYIIKKYEQINETEVTIIFLD